MAHQSSNSLPGAPDLADEGQVADGCDPGEVGAQPGLQPAAIGQPHHPAGASVSMATAAGRLMPVSRDERQAASTSAAGT